MNGNLVATYEWSHSTSYDSHWLRICVNSLKMHGTAVWTLITTTPASRDDQSATAFKAEASETTGVYITHVAFRTSEIAAPGAMILQVWEAAIAA
jgi:hypothetical protein